MNKLITECQALVKESNVPYAFCGGYALELFINQKIRSHSDIDISVMDEHKKDFIKFMQSKDWDVYEYCVGVNLLRYASALDDADISSSQGVWCVKPGCSLLQIEPIPNKENTYKYEIINDEQQRFDFIEVIFDHQNEDCFVCNENKKITRELDKAILYNNDIPYLSPEVVLFFKAHPEHSSSIGYQADFDYTVPYLSTERKIWLKAALQTSYLDGHIWLSQL